MKYSVYAIRDLKSGFLSPSVDVNDATAKRNFEHACRNHSSLFFSHPEDYSLYCIAEFDTDTGVITPVEHELLMYAPATGKVVE